MKLSSLTLLLLAAFHSAPLAYAESSYLTEGVNPSDLAHSSRFYDTGKGHYWQWSTTYEDVFKQYQDAGNQYTFMGELQNRIPDSEKNKIYTSSYDWYYGGWTQNLKNDSDTCWYQTSANLIQHWQTYYGVFAQNSADLPYGMTYSRDSLNVLGGTQSLRVAMVFYDNIYNKGGNLRTAVDYYFGGADLTRMTQSWRYTIPGNIVTSVSTSDYKITSTPTGGTASEGGYFKDYFPAPLQVGSDLTNLSITSVKVSTNNSETGQALVAAMGCSIADDGSIVQDIKGQIAYLSLTTGGVGHAITCYGFTLNGDNTIKSLKVTNSDDTEYALFDLYVDNSLKLYTDEACTESWIYANYSWTINGLENIRTPDELVQMYAEYTSQERNLEWNGKQSTWSDTYDSTTDELPTASTGWEVYVDSQTNDAHDKYYNSYYSESRGVEFGNHGSSNTQVSVTGAVRAAGMVLSADAGTNYTFTGTAAGTDSIDLGNGSLLKTGDSTDTLNRLSLLAKAVSLEAGELILASGTQLTAETGTVNACATLTLANSNASISELQVQDGGTFKAAINSSFVGNLTLMEGATLTFDLAGLSSDSYVMYFGGLLSLTGETYLTYTGLNEMLDFTPSNPYYDICLLRFDDPQNIDTTLFMVSEGFVMYDVATFSLFLSIPEPATATLSLLALTGLTMRRRRR